MLANNNKASLSTYRRILSTIQKRIRGEKLKPVLHGLGISIRCGCVSGAGAPQESMSNNLEMKYRHEYQVWVRKCRVQVRHGSRQVHVL